MPIEFTPPRRLVTAYLTLRKRLRGETPNANEIKPETIEAVNPDGTYVVKGRNIGTAGIAQFSAGQRVDVAWKNARPVAILAHNARRAQFAPVRLPGGPVIEMLLAAPIATPINPSHSIDALDIYFRNATQNTLLNCRDQITKNGFTIATGSLALVPNAWSLDHRHFLVTFTNQINGHPIIAIFAITGNEFSPLTGAATATLQSTVDLALLTAIPLGTISWTQNVVGGGSVSTAINLGTAISPGYSIFVPTDPFHNIIQTAAAGIFNAVYTRDGHLIIAVNLSIGNTVAGGPTNVHGGWNYPFVIDITNGAILFNGITQQGIWPTTIYNGAAFIQVGPGFYDETGTGTNAWQGGAQFYLIPDSTGGLRVFVGLRAFYSGGNPALAGKVQQYVEARDISTSTAVPIFPLSQYASGENSHLALLTANARYVMWMRASPGAVSSPDAFQFPSATTLAGYDFKEGIHITDLGTGKLTTLMTDYIPLTTLANIESFLDQVPYLLDGALLWDDHNDLRTNQVTIASRVEPEIVTFRHLGLTEFVVNVPFILPLVRDTAIPQANATMLVLPKERQYIVDMVNFLYLNSGHADMVSGYGIFSSPNSGFVCVQAIPASGVTLPS